MLVVLWCLILGFLVLAIMVGLCRVAHAADVAADLEAVRFGLLGEGDAVEPMVAWTPTSARAQTHKAPDVPAQEVSLSPVNPVGTPSC